MDENLATGLSGAGRIVRTLRFDRGVGAMYVVDLTAPPQHAQPARGVPCVTLTPHRP